MDHSSPVYLVLTNIPEAEWSYEVTVARKTIGRSAHAHIWIPPRFRLVSRQHAEVWLDRSGAWLRDLGSAWGTQVNRVRIDHVSQVRIIAGDRIALPGAELAVVATVSDLATMMPSVDESEETPGCDRLDPTATELSQRLTASELDVVLWLTRGCVTDQGVGERMFLSEHTVHNHLTTIMRKLGVHSRAGLVACLAEYGVEWRIGGGGATERRSKRR